MAITPRTFVKNPLILLAATISFLIPIVGAVTFHTPCRQAQAPVVKQVTVQPAVIKAAPVVTKADETRKGWLGIQIRTLTPEQAEALNAPPRMRGVLVEQVLQGMPAQAAGIRKNDIVTHFNGRMVTTACQLKSNVSQATPNTRAHVRVIRNGKPLMIRPTLAQAPNSCHGK